MLLLSVLTLALRGLVSSLSLFGVYLHRIKVIIVLLSYVESSHLGRFPRFGPLVWKRGNICANIVYVCVHFVLLLCKRGMRMMRCGFGVLEEVTGAFQAATSQFCAVGALHCWVI